MPPERKPGRARIYISFAGRDRPRVMRLVRWLNDSDWQVRADDRHSFGTGGDWMASAARRLESCDVILCVITPGWLMSEFCRFEFSYGASNGKFILPVICEPADLDLMPAGMRALPSVDLTRDRVIDYLALKDTLSQAGSSLEARAAPENEPGRARQLLRGLAQHRPLWLAAALLAIAIAAAWIWTLTRL
jgi:hypothetical protein